MGKSFKIDAFGYEVEIGKFAQQADGAVWLKKGGTVVLATVVSAPSRDFSGFLQLTTDYRELLSAAGKIPGSYHKREGKASDREVLIGRLIDRAIRPLFPEDYLDQVQVIITTYSVDKENAPHHAAFIAASLALVISKIPFLEPVAAVEAARVAGEWVFGPTHPQTIESDVRLMIAGTAEGITMVEGSGNQFLEKEFVDVMFRAHEQIIQLVEWQKSIQAAVGKAKEMPEDKHSLAVWQGRADQFMTDDIIRSVYHEDKVVRNKRLSELQDQFIENFKQEIEENETPTAVINYVFDLILKKKITELIIANNKRVDGRAFDQIRQIAVEVGLLPSVHGSSLFTRGRTQALVSATLGGGQDEQRLESIMQLNPTEDGSFMLHYNFLPFSVGEVKPMRGPGRREVGHGHLAASSFRYVRPSKEAFPYTIRLIADMLESDGSTSMATVCGSTMALMYAGVPLSHMVSGIAMGLLKNSKGDFRVLSDISGFEDQFGLMDFKVAGTENGITAIQMDIKYKGGLTRDIFEKALEQARNGRIFILDIMKKVLAKPNELSPLVPKVVIIKVNTDKIGAIIGSGGKTIREITETTGTLIDIEQDGQVKVFGGPDAQLDRAIAWVKTLAGQIEKGATFAGKIRRIVDFGMFVELVPGLDGLVHVSNIPRAHQRTFGTHYKVNQDVVVQVLDYDETNGRVSLRLVENESPRPAA
jgi:polyribonucleotide nucleotidyltransferase